MTLASEAATEFVKLFYDAMDRKRHVSVRLRLVPLYYILKPVNSFILGCN